MNDLQTILRDLAATIEARRGGAPEESYTAALLSGNEDALLKKLTEEAGEAALAAKGGDKAQLAAELADLLYHCLVVMARYNIGAEDIAAELARRRGQSGHAEKASRSDVKSERSDDKAPLRGK